LLGFIEVNPLINDQFGLEAINDFTQVNDLLFDGTSKTIDQDVAQLAASAIH